MFGLEKMAGNLVKGGINDLLGDLSIDKLLNNDFIKEHTDFSSFTELVTKFKPDFKMDDVMSLVGDTDFDSFIGKFTKFGNFTEMLTKAKELLG